MTPVLDVSASRIGPLYIIINFYINIYNTFNRLIHVWSHQNVINTSYTRAVCTPRSMKCDPLSQTGDNVAWKIMRYVEKKNKCMGREKKTNVRVILIINLLVLILSHCWASILSYSYYSNSKAFLTIKFSSVQSRWYLCTRESLYALHPVSQEFPQCCFWNSSKVVFCCCCF